MVKVSIDFETYSEVNIKDSGAFRYAEDPSTEPLILAYSLGRGHRPIGVDLTDDWDMVIRLLSPLFDQIAKGADVGAHNAQFERLIWEKTAIGRRFPIRPKAEAWNCTAARARLLAIPGSLDGAAGALGISTRKDKRGGTLIDLFSKPQKKTSKGQTTTWRIMPHERPDDFEDFIQYCEQDVAVEMELDRVLPELDSVERAAYDLDYVINDRGMPVNMDRVHAAEEWVAEYSERLMKRAVEISGCRPTQREKTMDFLATKGFKVEDLTAATVEQLAKKKGLPKDLVELLDLRIELSRAGTKKLKAIQNTVSDDGRIRGGFLFSAASTRRWSSTGVQMHNLQKPEGETNPVAVMDILDGDASGLEDVFARPLTALAQSVRSFFEAPNGRTFGIADYASVEPRGLAWVAGEEWITRAYHESQDLYKIMGGKVYGRDPSTLTKDGPERFMGKQLILGCFGPETLVLTSRGAVPILHVLPTDKVWDGVEWVSHQGVVDQGVKPTIERLGVKATEDHGVFISDGVHKPFGKVDLDRALSFASMPDPGPLSEDCKLFRQLFDYNPLTGELTHRHRGIHLFGGNVGLQTWWNKNYAGTKAGRRLPSGYSGVAVLGRRRVYKQTLIWEMVYGEPPAGTVDHVDRDPENDRLVNLRLSTPRQNSVNTLGRRRNTSGYVGVRRRRGKWCAELGTGISGDKHYLGDFDTVEEAARVRDKAAWKAHGVYARLNFERPGNVYDLSYAGPRNRFTILTEDGPLIVKNCGYSMGPQRFVETVAKFGVTLSLEESNKAVYGYRDSVPAIIQFWKAVNSACIKATRDWKEVRVGMMKFRPHTLANGYRVLFVDMPSGTICYPNPSVGQQMWNGMPSARFEFWTPLGAKFVKTDTFGGSITENIIQALTRDILRDGLLAADKAGFNLVGHVHDEAIAEIDDGPSAKSDLAEFEQCLTKSSKWAKGYPIASEGFLSKVYKK